MERTQEGGGEIENSGLKGEQDEDASCGLQKERGDKMKVVGLDISSVVGGPELPSDASEGTSQTLGRSTGYKRLPLCNEQASSFLSERGVTGPSFSWSADYKRFPN